MSLRNVVEKFIDIAALDRQHMTLPAAAPPRGHPLGIACSSAAARRHAAKVVHISGFPDSRNCSMIPFVLGWVVLMFAYLRWKPSPIEAELSDALLDEAIPFARFPKELKGELLRRARTDGVYFTIEFFTPLFRAACSNSGTDQNKYEALMSILGCMSAQGLPPQLADYRDAELVRVGE